MSLGPGRITNFPGHTWVPLGMNINLVRYKLGFRCSAIQIMIVFPCLEGVTDNKLYRRQYLT